MIWHIFKKDWNLEWRLALGVAFTQLLLSAVLWKQGPAGGTSGPLFDVIILLCIASLLARGFLIVETVHNDAIPGVRQDWLVRPIRRSELLAAKILFTILVVQLPVFAGDLLEALADGFSFGASLHVAVSRSFYMLITFCLPVLALSSITKNLLEVLTSGVIGVVIVTLSRVLTENGFGTQQLMGTGLGWTVETTCLATIVAFAAIILTMQFRRRQTVASRCLTGAGAVLLMAILLVPWQQSAFAVQEHLSPAPGAARNLEIAFEANPAPVPIGQRVGGWNGATSLYIPLTVSGLPADSILTDDHYELRLLDSQGVVRARSTSFENTPYQMLIGKPGRGPATSLGFQSPAVHAIVAMDTGDYVRLKDQKLRLEVDYSLTLLKLAESYAIPAVHGDERLPGLGWCKARVSELGDSVRLGCLQAGPPPDCYSWFLEHTPSGRRNVEEYACYRRDYSPYFAQFLPNALAQFGRAMQIRFHDPTGQAHYAVDAPDISEAKVVIRNYQPLEHFTRTITTPERPLSEWLAK